ncbi:MAG: N-acetyltransferase [Eubacterium sp.]|nr:N-acetyltransferase [Eubacterium sp.]
MIRKMREGELERVMEIWLASVVEGHRPFIPASYWQDHEEMVRREYMPQAEVVVCEEEGILKGFAAIVSGRHIGAFFVDPAYFREGVGTRLMLWCQLTHRELTLAVMAENARALAFYEDFGFQIGVEQIDEESGCMEYIMAWKE